jgi:hypothetical protein
MGGRVRKMTIYEGVVCWFILNQIAVIWMIERAVAYGRFNRGG